MSRMIVFRVEVDMHKLCDFKVTALRSHIPLIATLGIREIQRFDCHALLRPISLYTIQYRSVVIANLFI